MSAASHSTRAIRVVSSCVALFLWSTGCADITPPSPAQGATPTVSRVTASSSWSLIALPDTQTLAAEYPDIFATQTAWIAANASALDIRYVVHEGDITNDSTDAQWAVAGRCFHLLEGKVPHALALGNHDYPGSGNADSRDTAGFDNTFPRVHVAAQPGFLESYASDTASNSAFLFTAGGKPWLILSLEFGPRDDVLAWADGVLKGNSTATAIIVTHAYLNVDGTRLDHVNGVNQSNNPHDYDTDGRLGSVNDGEELWQKLIAPNPNVRLVLCGHMHAEARLTSSRDGMSPVHQLLADYQIEDLGGAGHLRILTFRDDGSIHVRTYSPYLDRYRAGWDSEFDLR
jgi:hypothetical protein